MKDNVFTLFNLFNLLIGVALICVKAYVNLAYLLVIAVNIAIGLVQEFRARSLVNKLSLLSAQKVRVIRDGTEREIPIGELTVGEVMVLEAGGQVCADATVTDGEAEVNESLLTGEADAVAKREGARLLSGSFVISGKCRARVDRAGVDSFAERLAAEAKKYKKINSELLASMRKVTRFTAFFILPVGVLMFLEAFFLRHEGAQSAVVGAAAALLGMLPKGLVLIISIALAAGIISLSKKKILVQELHSLETLARADVLCLDKTGTVTEGCMAVSAFYTLDSGAFNIPVEKALAAFVAASDDNNATFRALKEYFKSDSLNMPVISKIAFSSQRKWSAVSFGGVGTVVLGAPEKLYPNGVPPKIAKAQSEGKRVLCAAFTTAVLTAAALDGSSLPPLKVGAVIELCDPVRKDAKKTLDFFRAEGVDIKIISGDNAMTVAGVAARAGFSGSNSYIDMTGVTDAKDIAAAAAKYSIFGRVTPWQKKELVAALKGQGHTVAMAGDGVNDVLALKEADCGIAMAAGSEAARQVSQLVLINSDFTALPDAVMEGRRVINNITRVAGVFFIKTIYSVLLSLLFIIINVPFPFAPIQITLIDLAIEAYPAFFMSFERNCKRLGGGFLDTAVRRALPHAIVILLNVSAIILMSSAMNLSRTDTVAIMYFVTGFISLLALFRACLPFTKLRAFLCSTSAVGFYAAVYLFSDILSLTLPAGKTLWIILILAAVSILLTVLLTYLIEKTKKPEFSRKR